MKGYTRHSCREEIFFVATTFETADHRREQKRSIVVGRDDLLRIFAMAITIPSVRLIEAERDGKILMTYKNEML